MEVVEDGGQEGVGVSFGCGLGVSDRCVVSGGWFEQRTWFHPLLRALHWTQAEQLLQLGGSYDRVAPVCRDALHEQDVEGWEL